MDYIKQAESTQLSSLSLSRLEGNNAEESKRLLEACAQDGFFYLDLRDHKQLLVDYEALLEIIKQYFNEPLDQKMKDDRKSDTIGYEPVATSAGVLDGLPDYYESFKVSWNQLRDHVQELPTVVETNIEVFDRFAKYVHSILLMILSRLSQTMGRNNDNRFESYHRDSIATRTNLTFLKYPKQDTTEHGVGHNKHTDVGTLTFLLSGQRGLQRLTPEGWCHVEPRSGFAVVNVGDSLRFLSDCVLSSVIHRVLPVGAHQTEDRYTLAYFLRPEDDAVFKDINGNLVSARSWHDRKFDHFRASHNQQKNDTILMGGMEENQKFLQYKFQA
ncbi:Clavaminate synthase-like protein [Glarea lozoyensis ATCC 20868]|uniref:2-oxoglutarate-dependent dioxygenase gloE n=1 Tax=Glarea lozoyensis (strain ATCC 20868 / MF5171) TaxID=1116229 RepID=GLOE_GLAL2|nr:Clavaminate synthase-like protein [Glarea lozoyensis ATCC 20868]S3E7Q2.1 RecName: Full=2-oxoglutarate-dependent dioxygenase gloE; AltName: Full=Glutamine hydroxylase; AltName: Full=Pneumocandin biosynthesis cluster protein E [Glarea lozoyensis ATCC 20868]EPE34348.1 Clavaminate synthase-like protein [Glarea lozoyensis ATCC 20868]